MTAAISYFLLVLLAGVAGLILPGLAWKIWSLAENQDSLEHLADILGISIAVNAVLALIFFLGGVRLSATTLAGLYLVICLFALAGAILRNRVELPAHRTIQSWILAFLLFGVFIAWRLYQARDLVLPAWVDSLHHVLIVRKILEYGGLPPDLTPYLPVPFYYHYVFHSLSAVFAFWARLAPDQAVLILGQILNAAVCLSVYRLAKVLWGDVSRAGAAALLVAFFSHMPAYYLTWGRYTLLTGLVLLPLAMASAVEISRGRTDWSVKTHLALLTAGVLLAHYLTAILLALFLILLAFQHLWQNWHLRKIDLPIWSGLIGSSLAGLALAIPWLLRVWEHSQANFRVGTVISSEAVESLASPGYVNYLWYLLGPQRNHFLLGLAVLGLLLVLRNPQGRLLASWTVLVAVLSLPWGLRLGPFRPDHFTIVLFLPMALLVGNLLVRAGEALSQVRSKTWQWAALSLIALGMVIWGIKETRDILNPVTILATEADLEALEWIKENTPEDARFFINVTPWQGGIYRGVDGGAWILPLTGRWSLVPTVLYGYGETTYINQVNLEATQGNSIAHCSDEFWNLIHQLGITHLYIHQTKGSLQPERLTACDQIEPIYHFKEAWVYQVKQ
jgi:hypothetical protein